MAVQRVVDLDEEFIRGKETAFQAFIRKQGLKTTRQRQSIVRTFFQLRGHISVEELLREVKLDKPGVGYATVYRTLHLLVASGLVQERRFGDGLSRYEGHSEVEHHDHMICLNCGHIFEFFDPKLEALQKQIADDHGFQIYRHNLDLYGVCKDEAACRERCSADRRES